MDRNVALNAIKIAEFMLVVARQQHKSVFLLAPMALQRIFAVSYDGERRGENDSAQKDDAGRDQPADGISPLPRAIQPMLPSSPAHVAP
ncbi:MAG: hypothetical protein H7316_19610 [Tardiphaga sp.]|uniref:hypothetical protein n=1 Tax=Tardiphaga sp. TaxID=1926292 RepID=UPI0019C21617|nr:hypothetical protein [Tardiphaga sp.]MBC7585954.1 hypothetical protein [Tardiphaga sp.]